MCVVDRMNTKYFLCFWLLLFGACGSSDDLDPDEGVQPTDSALVDTSVSVPDGEISDPGVRDPEDLPLMEDSPMAMRDGQRPRRRSDAQGAGDASVELVDGVAPSDVQEPTDIDQADGTSTTPVDTGASTEDSSQTFIDKGAVLPLDDNGTAQGDAGTSNPSDAENPVEDLGSVEGDQGVTEPVDAGVVVDTATASEDQGTNPATDTNTAVEDIVEPAPDEGGPLPVTCSNSSNCPGGVCVGGLCFYDTGGTDNCEEVVLCMADCPDDVAGCDVDCLKDGDALAQAYYADLWLCWVTSEDFLEIAEACAGKAADCYYESEGPMNCAQAYECTFDCDDEFACVDDCLEEATSLAQTLYTGLAYCLQGACAGSTNPQCKLNNMSPGGVCHIFSNLCGNVPQ